jgi:hypothetical protein
MTTPDSTTSHLPQDSAARETQGRPTSPAEYTAGLNYMAAVQRQFLDCVNPVYKRDCMNINPLFCRHRGELFRCTGWYINGDVALVRDVQRFWGWDEYANPAECTYWSAAPDAISVQEVRTYG